MKYQYYSLSFLTERQKLYD